MQSDVLWRPAPARSEASHLAAFAGAPPSDPAAYRELWQWSVDDLTGFWGRVWDTSEVVASRRYDRVVGPLLMPGTQWFAGAELNIAANLLRRRDDAVAVFAAAEGSPDQRVTFAELAGLVGRVQAGLAELGVAPGVRVAAIVPNGVEALVTMLATAALGGIWSSCSPDFGPGAVIDRFRQIGPAVLVAADGYRYGGREHRLGATVAAVLEALPSVEAVVAISVLGAQLRAPGRRMVAFEALVDGPLRAPDFAALPFDHPLYVLYSSGTTGLPKSILHGAGGTLLQHLKEHRLHADVHAGDVVFWFTTCGWMMWNWLVSGLAVGATVVLYDGSPTWPDPSVLWRLAERARVTHFGTSPRFLAACQKAGLRPAEAADLWSVRTLLSTGAPLHPDQFDWVYDAVGQDLHLGSTSGGTDIVGSFVGPVPTLPVRRGRIQAPLLGMAVEAWDANGRSVVGQSGELVCTRPTPSMPLGLWGDQDGSRFRSAYFAANPGVWTHGDRVAFDVDLSAVISGRSDTALNPGGVRIGTAELYRAIEPLPEIIDSVAVARPAARDVEIILCVVPAEGVALDDDLRARIAATIRATCSPRHVPAHIVAVREIPYTRSGKKMEQAVRAAITGQPVPNRDALANPSALDEYLRLPLPPA